MQPRAPVDKYAISADRAFMREKVVTIYDALWRGELQQADWVGLFHLKVNAKWLQVQIATAPAAELIHGSRKVVRRLVFRPRVFLRVCWAGSASCSRGARSRRQTI